ncbi:MAG TPA: hypothetical protein PK251_15610 [Candidatus Latescibacteria bacterium]|nr:hypothetical protein [Kiritimatiellia bacterium]HOS66166.1 hypothetical protein [Candidatus Latescibacterota bacterium]HRT28305.1 hypothetical protein [Kiritimatiellia bacterium]
MNTRFLKLSLGLSTIATALSLFADVAWKYDTSARPADDVVEQSAILGVSSVRPSVAAAVDSGAFCEVASDGCAFDSRPMSMVLILR